MTRINTLMVICRKTRDFRLIDSLMERIDEFSDTAEPQLYVYSVRNGQAEELSSLLSSVFQSRTSAKDKKGELARATTAAKDTQEAKSDSSVKKDLFPVTELKKTVQTKPDGSTADGPGTLKGEVRIIPDTIRNALIIEALPSDYRIVTRILDRVDILPRQVLIEVIIAEITLTDTTKLGVEWTYSNIGDIGNTGRGDASGALGSGGLALKVGVGNALDAQITALATDSNVNIISSPKVMASDNIAARINVSNQIPVPSTSYNYADTNTSGVFETSIQYKDTGIILSVTPHINDRGLVSMEISQEVSEPGASVNVGGEDYLSFSERKVETTLTVKDQQTIVIGGLMREKQDGSTSGLPILSKIPLFGALFGSQNENKEKTELIILITPRVVRDLDDIDMVSNEFKAKVGNTMPTFRERISPVQ
jgi:general secretion pathway protein D